MKAAILNDYATTVVVTDIAQPALPDDSVMIEVHASSVNPVDNLIRAGYLKAMLPVRFPSPWAPTKSSTTRRRTSLPWSGIATSCSTPWGAARAASPTRC